MHIVEVWATAEVFDRTVLPSYLPRKPNGCFVLHNWNVDRAFQRAVIKPAIFTFDVTAKLIVRRFWLNDDSAADGIAPKQRPLRPLQHLNARNVICGHVGAFANQGDVSEIRHDGGNALSDWIPAQPAQDHSRDRKSTRLHSSH